MPPKTTAPSTADVTPPVSSTPVNSPDPNKPNGQSMMPKLILLIIVVLVVVGVVYALTRPKSKTTSNSSNTTSQSAGQNQTADVSITANGFVPATIQVKVGTQITWTNDDTAKHQVAADPYPKDDSIPNFDSSVVLEPKDTTSSTFETPGTYTYHDELNPLTLKGTIIVK